MIWRRDSLIKTLQGLSKMNRTHIHFASGLPQDQQVLSGMRGDCEVYIYIDLAKALHGRFTDSKW